MRILGRAWSFGFLVSIGTIAFALIAVSAAPTVSYSGPTETPFSDKVSAVVTHYRRMTPTIATAGLLNSGAIIELKAFGFVAILDLRGPEEGTAAEKADVEAAGLRYLNIPVREEAPTGAQVEEFMHVVEDAANYPLLIHCQTANRVGAIWSLYRVRKGVPFATAVEEGRSIGLQPKREKAVRARLTEPLPEK